jgi:hypothetical protein
MVKDRRADDGIFTSLKEACSREDLIWVVVAQPALFRATRAAARFPMVVVPAAGAAG